VMALVPRLRVSELKRNFMLFRKCSSGSGKWSYKSFLTEADLSTEAWEQDHCQFFGPQAQNEAKGVGYLVQMGPRPILTSLHQEMAVLMGISCSDARDEPSLSQQHEMD
jgi:hypothetical protein